MTDKPNGNIVRKPRLEPKPKGKGKRGRQPKRDIQDHHGLKAEVDAEAAAIMKKNPQIKRPPVEEAIANCLLHNSEIQPRSWWWKDDAPLGLKSAKALYYEAATTIRKHGPLEPHPLSLSALGKGIEQPAQSVPTWEEMIDEILVHKQWIIERKQAIPKSRFVAASRDFRREALQAIAALRHVANDVRIRLATGGPKHPPEKVERVRDVLASLEAQIANFEARVGKFGAA